jgi:hypothetical protein
VAEANEIAEGDLVLRIGSLLDHLAGTTTDGLPDHHGELRSGAAPTCSWRGVEPHRRPAGRRPGRAHASSNWPSRLCALFLPPPAWPGAELDRRGGR